MSKASSEGKGRARGEASGGRAAGRLKPSRRERAPSRCYGRVGRGREIKCESGRGEGEDGLTRGRGLGRGPWLTDGGEGAAGRGCTEGSGEVRKITC